MSDAVFLLLGHPNSGKTTLFNALTSGNERVTNYPGSTTQIKQGYFYSLHGKKSTLIDLPGTYTLTGYTPDDVTVRGVLLGKEETPVVTHILCVVDASNLNRSLYLINQALEFDLPITVVLTMMDVARQRKIYINPAFLEESLKIPVVPFHRDRRGSVVELKKAMCKPHIVCSDVRPVFSEVLEKSIRLFPSYSRGKIITMLFTEEPSNELIEGQRDRLNKETPEWKSSIIASRYSFIEKLDTGAEMFHKLTRSEIVDKCLLHPVLGWFPLLGFMGILLWAIFGLAPIPMEWISLFFARLSSFLNAQLSPSMFRDVLTEGIIPGVGNVIAFLPQVLTLFFFIELLESVGYLPRISFLCDRLMRRVGLQGRSFIPLLSSYACTIPGILSARSLSSRQERLTTILMAPWMSCMGRIPVYMLLINVLLPTHSFSATFKALSLIIIYLVGTLSAFLAAYLFRKTIFQGDASSFIMELPSFRKPVFLNLFQNLWVQAKSFIWRAGTVILLFSVILWGIMHFPRQVNNGIASPRDRLVESYAGKMGRFMEPVLQPLGYDWKIGVALLSSFAARESFVSTLAIIHNTDASKESLPCLLKKQTDNKGNPLYPPRVCIGLLFFFAFAFQCIGTLVVVWRETGSWRCPLFQFLYMNGIAYLAAFLINQIGLLL